MDSPSSSRYRKRARLSDTMDDESILREPTPLGHISLLHDSQFWFDDGNIILVAEQTAFRVHRGVLALHSDVFRNLFTVPQAPESIEEIDSCPVVHLPDTAVDVGHLIHAIYCGFHELLSPQSLPKWMAVAAAIRMGHKYEMEELRDAGLAVLRRAFPTRYDEWDSDLTKPSVFSGFRVTDAFSAVHLARLTGTTSVLPSALYTCCRLKTPYLLGHAASPSDQLAPDDLERCVVGLLHISQAHLEVKLRTRLVPAPIDTAGCTGGRRCATTLQAYLDRYPDYLLASIADGRCVFGDPLYPESSCICENPNLCDTCKGALRASGDKARRSIWNRLPKMFGIDVPGWGDAAPEGAET